jgi:tRNA (guanine26-N2/guanine27-N2)-dimethyltransferase
VYATIKYGAKHADESLQNMGYVLHCFKCFHRGTIEGLYPLHINEKCGECGSKLNRGGPMWIGKLFDPHFCGLMKDNLSRRGLRLGKRIEKILTLAEGEAEASVSYFVIDKLCEAMRVPVPSVKEVVQAVRRKGSEAYLTIFHTRGIKSNIPALEMKEAVSMLASRANNGQN